MTYRAKMKGGKVEFEGGITPADGVELRVEIVETSKADAAPTKRPSLSEVLMKFAGCMDDQDLPTDGSINHDHYIYGTPKR